MTTRTTCPYCGVGCGVVIQQDGSVTGDKDHPANQGRLCSKGVTLGQTLGPENRLLRPRVHGREVGWSNALAAVATRLSSTIDAHGPDAVAFYVSGQLLTEDYYVVNKLAKGFIGTSHLDTNSRLCMASTVVGHKKAFGSDTVPGLYEDLELADLVVLTGSNLAWCHPVLFQRLRAAKAARGTKVVVIDPRRTDTCDIANLHLALKPGSDVSLFNGLLHHLACQGRLDADFMTNHCDGVRAALAMAEEDAGNLAHLAQLTGIDESQLTGFFELFAATEKTVTVFSQGVNQSHNGTDKVNAILNCHLATGRIGKPGSGPFSVTGQPNAMGGREVGGLANTLAAHMDFTDDAVDRVGRFWSAKKMATEPGLKAVDLFRAIDSGRIKFLWVMATNPAVSLPETDMVRRALKRCQTVVVSDCIDGTDTGSYAHIHLPAAGWGEKNGTVTNSERVISRQRPFVQPRGQAKPDWWILSQVGDVLFPGHFTYSHPAEIFDEHARLSAFENNGSRDFDIGGLAGLSRSNYDALEPIRWPVRKAGQTAERLFGQGGFFTPSGRARLIPVKHIPLPTPIGAAQPLVLNTGRYRDQWHTMTRTGLVPQLAGHRPEALLDIHPDDAAKHGIEDGGLVRVSARAQRMTVRARLTNDQRPGELFAPMHWSDMNAGDAGVGPMIPADLDPYSGQPASKCAAVSIRPYRPAWQGVLISRGPVEMAGMGYWNRRPLAGCHITRIADEDPAALSALIAVLDTDGSERMEFLDGKRGAARRAWVRDGRLTACLFADQDRIPLDIAWLESLFVADPLGPDQRSALLAGRAPGARADSGPTICSCHQVGLNTILSAIRSDRLVSVEEIGAAVKAGTNCGSCIPELRQILIRETAAEVA